jgi:hypothetical protein
MVFNESPKGAVVGFLYGALSTFFLKHTASGGNKLRGASSLRDSLSGKNASL